MALVTAITLSWTLPPAYSQPMRLESTKKQFRKEISEEVIKLRNTLEIKYAMARIHLEKGQPKQAIALLKEVLNADIPESGLRKEARRQRIHIYKMITDIAIRENLEKETLEFIDQALEKHKDNRKLMVRLYMNRSRLHQDLKNLDEALSDLEAASRINEQIGVNVPKP